MATHSFSTLVTRSWPLRTSSVTPVTKSWPTSGPRFCVIWVRKMPASGWGSLWDSSSFVPWFSTLVFRNSSGVRPYVWVQDKFVYFRQSAQKAVLCPAELLRQFFNDSAFNLLRNLCDVFRVNSRNRRVSWLAVSRMFLVCFSCNGCQLSFVSQWRHLFEGKMLRSYEDWISFSVNRLENITKMWFFRKNN